MPASEVSGERGDPGCGAGAGQREEVGIDPHDPEERGGEGEEGVVVGGTRPAGTEGEGGGWGWGGCGNGNGVAV